MKRFLAAALSVLLASGLLIPGTGAAQTPVRIRGSWNTHIRTGYIELYMSRIKNTAYYGSGSLRLDIYAAKRRYRGKSMSAYQLASMEIPPLEGRSSYVRINQQLSLLTMPPAGRYYVILVLREIQEMGDEPAQWAIVDWSNSDRRGWIG